MAARLSSTAALGGKRVATAALAALAAGCANSGANLDVANERAVYRDEISAFANPNGSGEELDPVAAAALWSVRYDQNPEDWRAGVAYAAALRKLGSLEKAVEVMGRVSARDGDKPEVDLEMGRTLIEAGRAFEAVRFLEEATAARPRDWRAQSAFGVALDQIGEHAEARRKYEIALTIAPGAATLLNNKGLSYALSGDLDKAVQVLRAAATAPGGDARVRQNLALALAIKGDLTEAERLARSDLPPQVANANIDYFRSLVAQPAYWQDFAASDVDAPTFGDEATADDAPSLTSRPSSGPQTLSPAGADDAPETDDDQPTLRLEPREPAQEETPDEAPSPLALTPATPVTNASNAGEETPLRLTPQTTAPTEPAAQATDGAVPEDLQFIELDASEEERLSVGGADEDDEEDDAVVDLKDVD